MTDQAKQTVPEVQVANLQWCQTRTSRSGSGSSLLQVPSERYGATSAQSINRRSSGIKFNEILFEEESDVIKSCCKISSAVFGLMKSFSTTDICTLSENCSQQTEYRGLRQSWSEMMLFSGSISRMELPNLRRLDYTSRSCSTWVNLGDPVSSTSQLPSPQAQPFKPVESPTITSQDFILSVNKKCRQMYLRRRLRAIGRLVNSCQTNSFNDSSQAKCVQQSSKPLDNTETTCTALRLGVPNVHIQDSQSIKSMISIDFANLCFKTGDGTISLTAKDIERDKGKPLSKYERNIMIFNWLQDLNESDSTAEQLESVS